MLFSDASAFPSLHPKKTATKLMLVAVLGLILFCRMAAADSNNASGSDDVMKVGGNEVLRLTTTKKVGIGGVTAPNSALEVSGSVKVGNGAESCNGGTKGALAYVSTTDVWTYCNGTAWTPFKTAGVSPACTNPCTHITISASTTNVNLFTLAGSPGTAGNYEFTVNSGVILTGSTTATPAMTTGTFPAGSGLWLVNNGIIAGAGGVGGAGGSGASTGGALGNPGGPALNMAYPLTITNNGVIEGGGGAGGGGGA